MDFNFMLFRREGSNVSFVCQIMIYFYFYFLFLFLLAFGFNFSFCIKYKDKKEIYRQFMVCNLDIDLIGIDLINKLGISCNAKAKQVFSISDEPDIL